MFPEVTPQTRDALHPGLEALNNYKKRIDNGFIYVKLNETVESL